MGPGGPAGIRAVANTTGLNYTKSRAKAQDVRTAGKRELNGSAKEGRVKKSIMIKTNKVITAITKAAGQD